MTNDTQNNHKPDNINYIHFLNRKFLHAINKILSRQLPHDDDERKQMIQEEERLLGGKNSIASALGDVADTELKIEKQRPSNVTAANPPPPLDDNDVKLMRDYTDKHKPT
jgi:hypothetical protein